MIITTGDVIESVPGAVATGFGSGTQADRTKRSRSLPLPVLTSRTVDRSRVLVDSFPPRLYSSFAETTYEAILLHHSAARRWNRAGSLILGSARFEPRVPVVSN